jgi:hypothetical protein
MEHLPSKKLASYRHLFFNLPDTSPGQLLLHAVPQTVCQLKKVAALAGDANFKSIFTQCHRSIWSASYHRGAALASDGRSGQCSVVGGQMHARTKQGRRNFRAIPSSSCHPFICSPAHSPLAPGHSSTYGDRL